MANFTETRARLPSKGALPSDKIKVVWTKADQFEAVKRGYFIARVHDDNHAWVIILSGDRFKTDAAAMAHEDNSWRTAGDPHALKLCQFVAQQDWHGCRGVWASPTIETCTNPDPRRMRWLKAFAERNPERNPNLKRNQGGRPRGPTGYALDRRAVERVQTIKGAERQRHKDHAERVKLKYGVEPLTPAERTANRLAGVAKRQALARLKQIQNLSPEAYAEKYAEWFALGIHEKFTTWLRRTGW